MYLRSSDICIFIASHISNSRRIGYLFECIHSLLKQTIPVSIYLSISFETTELKHSFAVSFSEEDAFKNTLLYLTVKERKTPQMRHMYEWLPMIEQKHSWIMFCDDDDTYENNRCEVFMQSIESGLTVQEGRFVGAYESTFGKNHREQRHEFWCYCVHQQILRHFMEIVAKHPDVLDNKCCDVLFGEYLRRSRPELLYLQITTPLYHYRVSDNSDSVTGVIQTRNKLVRRAKEITEENMQECAKELDEYLNSELSIYLHDTYLRTLIGQSFEEILKNEFKSEIAVLHLIDKQHLAKIKGLHIHLREICNRIYDIKI
jgi:hypothetical protein